MGDPEAPWADLTQGEPTAEAKDHGPIALAVADIEKAMAGADELDVLKAVVRTLASRYDSQAARRGGYGGRLTLREESFMHERAADYPDQTPPTHSKGRKLRLRDTESKD